MDGVYPICYMGRTVGKATVVQEGLYYCFTCKCRTMGEGIFRILIRCGDKESYLGILIPEGDGCVLSTRLSVRKIGCGEPTFQLVGKHEESDELFVPIRPEEPFAYLEKLKNAYLQIREGQMGAVIKGHRGN